MLKNNRGSQFELLDKHILVRFVAIGVKSKNIKKFMAKSSFLGLNLKI